MSIGNRSNSARTKVLSVGDLIQEIESSLPWTLCIAQRAFQWNPLRVVNLVDSLLRGFPIGTLIVVESKDPYYKIAIGDDFREVEDGSMEERTQIIDGQQRCAAILAAFCGKGLPEQDSQDRLYLWINVGQENHRFKEFDEKRGQRYYFHWSSRKELNHLVSEDRKAEKLPPRSPSIGWVLFHRLYQHAINGALEREVAKEARLETGESSEFKIIADLLKSLQSVHKIPRIPVHKLSPDHDNVQDLHQVFIRINTGGMPLGAVDEFFAGVKKYWPEAEEHVRCLVGNGSPFNRRDAITILARCAAKSLEQPFDPYRLNLQDLARVQDGKENLLIDKMRELAPLDGSSPLVDSVRWVGQISRANLFSGAREIPAYNHMAAVAWAFRYGQSMSGKLPRTSNSNLIKPIIRFLFWTTVFGSRRYSRTRFDREVFRLAWENGNESRLFPYLEKDFQKICFDYERIKVNLSFNPRPTSLTSDEPSAIQILNITQWNRALFLGVYQEIEHSPIDWDHILAGNYARRYFKNGHKYDYRYWLWVHRIGNIAGIDARANRVLQDRPPSDKFGREGNISRTYLDVGFIKTNPKLNEIDYKRLCEVEEYMKKGQKEKAGNLFKRFVADRSMRIWLHVIEEVGDPPSLTELTD